MIKNLIKIIILVASTIIFTDTFADEGFNQVINQTKIFAQEKKNEAYKANKSFNPQNIFEHYTEHPPEAKYYQGIQSSDTQNMTNDAMQSRITSETGKNISQAINQHPHFVINQSDPSIQHSEFVASQADNIIHGFTNQYVDCKPKEACTTQYQNKFCEELPQAIFQTCTKKLTVEPIPHESVTHYPFTIRVRTKEHDYAGVKVNLMTGQLINKGPREANFGLDGRLPAKVDCNSLTGSVTNYSDSHGSHLDSITFPTCQNGNVLDFHVSGGSKKAVNVTMQLDITSKVVTYEMQDKWVDGCLGLFNETTCTLQSQKCSIPKSTQIIQGIPVTRDCWENQFQYICRGGMGEGTCKALQAEGCEQLSSICENSENSENNEKNEKNENNQCLKYKQTYRCSVKTCSPTTDIICGDGKDYCLDGNCTDHSYQPSRDFAQGASALSALADASKQFDPASLTAFAGYSAECSEKPVGYSNCCTESGWGQDAGLDHCAEEAKKLHESREKKLVVKVGRYCSGPSPVPCIEHNQVYCVFNSKLAKIIQEQGRKGQLKIDFGSGKHPNCLGISIDQLKSIDFSKIDFKDFYADLDSKMTRPDIGQLQQMILQHIDQYKQSRKSNG